VNKAKYSDYQSVFENMENTLRVFRKAGGLNTGSASGNLFSNTQIPTNISAESVFGTKIDGGADKPKKQNGGDDMTLYLIVGALAIGGFIWFKKKRGG
jgi:LPXTG-motif cell wall-anchored protein